MNGIYASKRTWDRKTRSLKQKHKRKCVWPLRINRVCMCFSVDCVWHVAWHWYIGRWVPPAEQRATGRPSFCNVYMEQGKEEGVGCYQVWLSCNLQKLFHCVCLHCVRKHFVVLQGEANTQVFISGMLSTQVGKCRFVTK